MSDFGVLICCTCGDSFPVNILKAEIGVYGEDTFVYLECPKCKHKSRAWQLSNAADFNELLHRIRHEVNENYVGNRKSDVNKKLAHHFIEYVDRAIALFQRLRAWLQSKV